jgi:hypothetical protein
MAVAGKAGFPEEAVRALAKGKRTASLTEDEKLAQRFTRQLTIDHQVP